MEFTATILTDLAPYMPFICFGLLLLAGLNIPISEDMVFLASAAITISVMPQNIVYVYIACFSGALASDIIAYSIGRFGGRKLLSIPTIRKMVTSKTEKKIEGYYERYGVKTLFFGRFIPFGVRNMVFFGAGFSRVPLIKFVLVDIIPLTITSSLLFYLGITFGENYKELIPYIRKYETIIAIIAGCGIALFIALRIKRKSEKKTRLPRKKSAEIKETDPSLLS